MRMKKKKKFKRVKHDLDKIKMNPDSYTSDNGYTGLYYGESSLSIYDSEGYEVLHTGFRSIDSRESLIECVESFPEFIEYISKGVEINEENEK